MNSPKVNSDNCSSNISSSFTPKYTQSSQSSLSTPWQYKPLLSIISASKNSFSSSEGPITPLTGSSNHGTPSRRAGGDKNNNPYVAAVLTPKIAASCPGTWSRSPFSSTVKMDRLFEKETEKETNTTNRILFRDSTANTDTTCNTTETEVVNGNTTDTLNRTAAFWSYPNLSINQMGLDAEPPSPDGISFSFSFDQFIQHSSTVYMDKAVPGSELLQSTTSTSTSASTNNIISKCGGQVSPLSWLLNVTSQDQTADILENSQQILSEYLNLQF